MTEGQSGVKAKAKAKVRGFSFNRLIG